MKNYLTITILWLLITIFSSMPMGPILAILTIPFVLSYLIFCFVLLILKKKTIKEVGIKFSIILSSYLLIGLNHQIISTIARNDAEEVVTQIKTYKSKHGIYPKQLSDIGIKDHQFKSISIHYFNEDNPEYPILFYPSTVFVFDDYSYNFKESEWEFHPD